MSYILDTNIITAIFKNNKDVINKVQQIIAEGKKIYINCISYYEIKRGLLAADASNKIDRFNEFCNKFGLLLLDSIYYFDEASEIYAYLKKEGSLIEDADILIASLTKLKNYILITDNIQHFNRVQGLKIENWLA